MGDCIINLPATRQGKAEIVVGGGVTGIDRKRSLVMDNGLVNPPHAGQGKAEIVVGLHAVGRVSRALR